MLPAGAWYPMDDLEQARQLFLQGVGLHNAGRFADAEARYRDAAGLAPERPSILSNLAAVLISQARFAEAVPWCERVLQLEPAHADALHALQTCRRMLADAENESISANALPSIVEKASLLSAHGDHLAGLDAWDKVLALQPQHPQALLGRARALARLGQADAAVLAYRAAIDGEDGGDFAGEDFCADVVAGLRPQEQGAVFEVLLVRALHAPWHRASELVDVAAGQLLQRAWVVRALDNIDAVWPARVPAEQGEEALRAAADDALFNAVLKAAVLPGEAFERLLANLRFSLLSRVVADSGLDDATLALGAALAAQMLAREYAMPQPAQELQQAALLAGQLTEQLASGSASDPHLLLTVVLYSDPGRRSFAPALAKHAWPAPVQALVQMAVLDRQREEQLADAMPSLRDIADEVSKAAREQYEQNPYPRWIDTPSAVRRMAQDEYVNWRLGRVAAAPRAADAAMRVLVAGAGTGQQPIELANRLQNAQVLGIDLSRASLAYAQRQAERIGVGNLRFLHADILALVPEDGPFDLIEASGVLHHMRDPALGLRRLRACLAPDGLMRIGLYSTRARRAVVAARALIAREGFAATAQGMRAFRQQVLALPADDPARGVASLADFYAMSECRDLAFHVHETSFDPPAIAELLHGEAMDFLGFELSPAVQHAFVQQFPQPFDGLDLDCWDRFEELHPGTFTGMYQFWARPRQLEPA